MKISFIGTGNVATALSQELDAKGNTIIQVAGRNASAASALARMVHSGFTTSINEVDPTADLYFICVKDGAIAEVVNTMPSLKGIVVHTSGSTGMDVLKAKFKNHGVIYPLQSFSKFRKPDLSATPVFIEAGDDESEKKITGLASQLSSRVIKAGSRERMALHIAGVFASNFSNHMYTLAFKLCKKHGLNFEDFFPLILETAQKVGHRSPIASQTGPAVRKDLDILEKHKSFLQSDYDLLRVYNLISDSIIKNDENH